MKNYTIQYFDERQGAWKPTGSGTYNTGELGKAQTFMQDSVTLTDGMVHFRIVEVA